MNLKKLPQLGRLLLLISIGGTALLTLATTSLNAAGLGSGAALVPPSTFAAHATSELHHDFMLTRSPRLDETAPERAYHVESYDLHGQFNWNTQTLLGEVTITLRLLPLAQTTIALDSKVTVLSSVTGGAGTALPFAVDDQNGLLRIDLTALGSVARAAPIVLRLVYQAKANDFARRIEAFDPTALRAIPARAGDPVTARSVNTMSEPLGASEWMPCHDSPADRSLFAIELTMDESETMIANGALQFDRSVRGQRTMRYATSYTLPTYLMAFAQGEFSVTTTKHGDLDIAIWARKGLPIDASGLLRQLDRQIGAFAALLGPYPFEKYAIVLLPEFSTGGEEHAGITFQGETESTQANLGWDMALQGHELAHQWFGDYMTVTGWDDVWIKEGMATLLELEQARPWEDQSGETRLLAGNLDIKPGEAIRDPAVAPVDKYTTGPYGRAAWLLTQIRSVIGEQVFWSTLRQVLADHAFNSIDTNTFLAAFKPSLGDSQWSAAVNALPGKVLPKITLTAPAADGTITATLSDPDHALLLPVEWRQLDGNGAYTTFLLADGKNISLKADATKLWVVDPQDRHPVHVMLDVPTATQLAPLLQPGTPALAEAFTEAPASDQRLAFNSPSVWLADPVTFQKVFNNLDSALTQIEALDSSCQGLEAAGTAPAKIDAFRPLLSRQLTLPPYFGVSSWYGRRTLTSCLKLMPTNPFAEELQELTDAPDTYSLSELRILYLSSFSFDTKTAFDVWSAVGQHAPSARVRAAAVRALVNAVIAAGQGISAADLAAYQAYFRNMLETSHVSEVLAQTLLGPVATNDTEALPALAEMIADNDAPPAQKTAVCAAVQLTKANPAAWAKFLAELGPLDALPETVQTTALHPETCTDLLPSH